MASQCDGQVLDTRSAGWNSVCYKISLSGYQRCGDDGPRSCNGGSPKLPPPCVITEADTQAGSYRLMCSQQWKSKSTYFSHARKPWDMEHKPILLMGTDKMKRRYGGWSFNSGTDFFFPQKTIKHSEVATEWNIWQLCASACAYPEVSTSLHSLCESLSVNTFLQCALHLTMDRKLQQLVCIDFCFRLGKTGAETYEMLLAAFGESRLSRSKTFEWYCCFKSGHRSFEDDPPPRQTFHLPHRGDCGTCARNHLQWPTSDYQRGCRGS